MTPTATLSSWTAALAAGSADDRQILANIQNEGCVAPATETAFWSALENCIKADTTLSARHALSLTAASPTTGFCLRGRPALPVAPAFTRLKRVTGIKDLPYLVPESVRIRLGLDDEDELARPTEWAPDYPDRIAEGFQEVEMTRLPTLPSRQDRPVWATDADAIMFGSAADAVDRLGLPDYLGKTPIIEISYDRPAVALAPLHVPTALDAHGFPAFRPTVNCSTPTGFTRPLRPMSFPCPEVVHKAVAIPLSCRILN